MTETSIIDLNLIARSQSEDQITYLNRVKSIAIIAYDCVCDDIAKFGETNNLLQQKKKYLAMKEEAELCQSRMTNNQANKKLNFIAHFI